MKTMRRARRPSAEITLATPEVLRLAEQAYIRTGAWGSLLDILRWRKPTWVMMNIVTNSSAWREIGLMDQARADLGSDGLKPVEESEPKTSAGSLLAGMAMAEHLIECDDHDTAQEILLDGLKRQYDDRLVR